MNQPSRTQGRAGVEALARAHQGMARGDHKGAFRGRLSPRVAGISDDVGIEMPEQLLFMSDAEIKALEGVGPAAVKEVQAYRAKFAPAS